MADRSALTFLRSLLALGCAMRIDAAELDPMEVFQKVSAKVVAAERHVPNYTCVETVTREYFEPAVSRLPLACSVLLERRRHPTPDLVLQHYATDRLRLDVTLTRKGEIFSWVGASSFDEGGIENVVRQGPMATGAFAGFLLVVFQTDDKKFGFKRNVVVDGRNLMEFWFQVDQTASRFRVKAGEGWVYTAYSGTLRVDPETYDVVAMQVETAELPTATGDCLDLTAMDLATVDIGGTGFVLPTRARQRFVAVDGTEAENTTTFANCREFHGESTIIYEEDPAPTDRKVRASREATRVTPGLRFVIELTSPIDTDTAAAGDSFTARLVDALRDPKQKVLARSGSVVVGRLLRVENFFGREPSVVVVLRPESVEIHGTKVPLTALRNYRAIRPVRKGMRILLPRDDEEHAAMFQFIGAHVIVKKGLRSEWRTAVSDVGEGAR